MSPLQTRETSMELLKPYLSRMRKDSWKFQLYYHLLSILSILSMDLLKSWEMATIVVSSVE